MKTGFIKIDKKLKMRLFGISLFTVGLVTIVYSIFFGSSNMGFWSLYIGLLLIVTGLGFLGLNIGSPLYG
jgi:hypothetical protein